MIYKIIYFTGTGGTKLVAETFQKVLIQEKNLLGRGEAIFATLFGKAIYPTKNCNGCAICAKGCPTSNIKMVNHRPKFDFKCAFCLKCLYSCPQKALRVPIGNVVLLKEGFDLNKMVLDRSELPHFDLERDVEGAAWIGVKKYIAEVIN